MHPRARHTSAEFAERQTVLIAFPLWNPWIFAGRLAKNDRSRLRDRGQKKNGETFGPVRLGLLSRFTQRESLQDPRTLVRVIGYVNTNYCIQTINFFHHEPVRFLMQKAVVEESPSAKCEKHSRR